MAKAKTARETPSVTPMRVPAHGRGALRVGGTNKGGPGAPPSAIRELLRGSIAERTEILTAIMDGEPVQRITVPLGEVLKYAACPKCASALTATCEPADMLMVELVGKVSASPKDRIAAWDTAAKYGLGALKEISVENVRERVQGTLAVIRKHTSPEQASAIIAEMRPLWA